MFVFSNLHSLSGTADAKRRREAVEEECDKRRKVIEDEYDEDMKRLDSSLSMTLRRDRFRTAFRLLTSGYGRTAASDPLSEISTVHCIECKKPELTWLTPHCPPFHRLSLFPAGCDCATAVLCTTCFDRSIRTCISYALHMVIPCPVCKKCIVLKPKHMFIGHYKFEKADANAAEDKECPFELGVGRQ